MRHDNSFCGNPTSQLRQSTAAADVSVPASSRMQLDSLLLYSSSALPLLFLQVLTWVALPFFQVYSDAGDFTVGGKCLTSLKENGLLYGLAGAAGAVGLIIILMVEKTLRLTDLPALGMALSNTFALSVGIILMGYGLVELPRELWKSDPNHLLKWCAHRAGRYAEEVIKTTNELESVVTIIVANDKQMPRRDPLRPYMQIISKAADDDSPVKPSAVVAAGYDMDSMGADDLEYNYDKAGLAALRRRLAAAIHEFKGAHAQYEDVIRQALDHEAVLKCRQLGVYEPPGLQATDSGFVATVKHIWWKYRCLVQPVAAKVFAVFLVFMTGCVIWSEATIFTGENPDLSPFSKLIKGAVGSVSAVQFLVLVPLAYICWCTYFALFRINAFNYNKLIPRTTTGAALMQNGSLMSRFAAPTCWNLLHMIHMDGQVTDAHGQTTTTVFTQNMGTMGVLPVLGQHLNTYLPLLLVVHCALIYFNMWERLAGACVGNKFKFSNDDVDDQYTEKGRILIRKEGEALANGMRIGEILAADDLELQLPGIKPKKRMKKKGSWFNFGRQQQDGAAAGSSDDAGSSSAAAGRSSERTPMLGGLFSGQRSEAAGESKGGALRSSLVKNK
eukprot:GHUV01016516.1.p1 GENE.GHUV01016516.1~~GHUV01016516.1.p1  ORF type:complete len:615 (+),score=178.39 GHUV01016516.1:1103-2947(+)